MGRIRVLDHSCRRDTLGNKPIKYLILSHFHDDHTAGIGYYVDAGAQIVTIEENAPIVTR